MDWNGLGKHENGEWSGKYGKMEVPRGKRLGKIVLEDLLIRYGTTKDKYLDFILWQGVVSNYKAFMVCF